MKVDASIIIRAHNEEAMIGRCLARVFEQTYKNFEVLIIDSESTDRTLEIARKFNVRILSIKKSEFTYGKSLNKGCRAATGKYCVFISAHAIPGDKFWLENLINPLKEKSVAGVFGKQIPHEDCDLLDKKMAMSHWKNPRKDNEFFFSNANSAIKKSLWKKVKFNETLPSTEDHDWAKRVALHGFKTLYEPAAAVYHSHNEGIKQRFCRTYREMLGSLMIGTKVKTSIFLLWAPFRIYTDCALIIKNRLGFRHIPKSFAVAIIESAAMNLAFFTNFFRKRFNSVNNFS